MKLFITLLSVCAVLSASAATYYISPTGSDSNDGMSRSTPFGSFLTATEALMDGDTLVIMEGTYENPINREGLTDATLYLGLKTNGYHLSNVTIQGDSPVNTILNYVDNGGTNVTDVRHIRFYGTGNTVTSLKMEGDMFGDGWWSPLVYIYQATNNVISNMWIKVPTNVTGRTAISPVWVGGVLNSLITHCLIDGGGIGAKDFNWDDNHMTTFRNLTCVNQLEGGGDRGMGIVLEGNGGSVVENCVFADNANYAISCWPPEGSLPAATQTVENCMYWNTGAGWLDVRNANTNIVVLESGNINQDPQFSTTPDGYPYSVPVGMAQYGWHATPEPGIALFALGALGLAFLRKK